MNVSSINDRIQKPKGAVLQGVRVEQAWFVISYLHAGQILDVYYNQQGREAFAVETKPKPKFWRKFWKSS